MNKDRRIYFTVCCFLIVATFIYVFSGISGLNLPRYYPESPTGPSMGYYGKVGFTLLLAVPLSLLFYLFLPSIERFKKYNSDFWRGMTILSLLYGMMFFVAEEWHKWGIKNTEPVAFFLILILFLSLLKIVLWIEHGE